MYDENDMYNEVFGTLKSGVQNAQQVMALLEKLKDSSTAPAQNTVDKDFVFTGQSTDLRYFQNAESMPIKLIEQIPDESLKQAVMDEFNKAIRDGKLTMDLESKTLNITEKGKEFITKPEFQKAAAQDLQKFTQERMETLGVELDGSMQDLGFFKFSDKLDLQEVMQSGNVEMFSKISENMYTMAEKGLVSIDKTIVTLTDKGRELLNSELMQQALSGVSEKALSVLPGVNIAGKVFVATKKLLGSKVLGNTMKQ